MLGVFFSAVTFQFINNEHEHELWSVWSAWKCMYGLEGAKRPTALL